LNIKDDEDNTTYQIRHSLAMDCHRDADKSENEEKKIITSHILLEQ
jgi:hypothetical protein